MTLMRKASTARKVKNLVILDVLTSGAVGDGKTNDTDAVNACIGAAPEGATIKFPAGQTYVLDGLEPIEKSITLDITGAKFIVNPSKARPGYPNGSPVFWFRGAVEEEVPIANTIAYSKVITLSNPQDAAKFSIGDDVVISDNYQWKKYNNTDSGFFGRAECNTVLDINGATITLGKPVELAYNVTPTLLKIKTLDNVRVIGEASHITEPDPGEPYDTSNGLYGACPHIFHFQYCKNPNLSGVTIDKWRVHAVNFHRCINPVAKNFIARDPYYTSTGGNGYFLRGDQCLGGNVTQNYTRSVRHAIDWVYCQDSQSSHNISYGCIESDYTCHGLGNRRIKSVNDTSIGSLGYGWVSGNTSFREDYDFTVENPTYYGFGSGVVRFTTYSERMRIINPTFFCAGGAIQMNLGARGLEVVGGTIAYISDVSRSRAILINQGDLSSEVPRDVSFVGTLFKHPGLSALAAFIEITSCKGTLEFRDLEFEINDATCKPMLIGSSAAPEYVVVKGVQVSGVYSSGLWVENSASYLCSVMDCIMKTGNTGYAFHLPITTKTRFTGNVVENTAKPYEWTGGTVLDKASNGAIVRNNVPEVPGSEQGVKYSSAAPTTGVWRKGQISLNTGATSGGNVGWICTRAGEAVANTWAANTAYAVGEKVQANAKAYLCTVAGTSGSTAPSHSSGTATDGTVTWEYLGPSAAFSAFGTIT
ncbi:glycosyl hydrolase family 28-related protein [Paenibacillus thailandensis]|uniref:Glycosyl hydrolase family 28-related protein n=1 Tax=Paenibacillus thailandensis TaxID=393250 RepID=A0ABW5QSX6_9BACL